MRDRTIILSDEQKELLKLIGSQPVSIKITSTWLDDRGYSNEFIENLIKLRQVRWNDGELELSW